MTSKIRNFSGTTNPEERAYEKEHRNIARQAAAEGIVLLKNENNVLPMVSGSKVALYGAGAIFTIKGGMGSGDVNSRETINIYSGLLNAGYQVTTTEWLMNYKEIYEKARIEWRQVIWDKEDSYPPKQRLNLFRAYSSTPFLIPAGPIPEKTDADTAIFVLSRNSGEGKDRMNEAGDYLLTGDEEAIIAKISILYKHVILATNTGGIIDLSFVEKYPNINAIIHIQQPGMEAGNAFADIISGKVAPSGKLTDTWAFNYNDYPNAAAFSHMNGNVEQEEYIEGIYVGYRYFDTFEIPVRYSFGYGMSYTPFEISIVGIDRGDVDTNLVEISVRVQVKNVGNLYSAREVVQVYCSCPQGKLAKEYRRLVGFQKTKTLAPGETHEVTVKIPANMLVSYDEKQPGWILENGCYGIFVGNSLENAEFVAAVQVEDDAVIMQTENICPLQQELNEMSGPKDRVEARRNEWLKIVEQWPGVTIHSSDFTSENVVYDKNYEDTSKEVRDFVDSLSEDKLVLLATGEIGKSQGSNLGSAGISVPGSAAETSSCAVELGLPYIVLADGPAGLRLNRTYQVENEQILPGLRGMGIENGFLCREETEKKGDTYYQYCTAIPAGTLLAQTWDPELMKVCGKMAAVEMQEFGITLWLAPGMNIHRNPLCGRNFEYYSEDPLLSGIMAAALTNGVQSEKSCGTTIKHFACNNQEDNRMGSNSIISERALREIYLKGFEIAVKESEPMSIMTSYNLVNGTYAANSFDLCTKVARNEWGFKGLIMTDWTTTMKGPACTASGCMRAGNDIVMPGCTGDHENILQELKNETLDIRDLKRSICRLVSIVWKTKQ